MTWGSWGGRIRAAFIVEIIISPTSPMKAGLMWFALIAGSEPIGYKKRVKKQITKNKIKAQIGKAKWELKTKNKHLTNKYIWTIKFVIPKSNCKYIRVNLFSVLSFLTNVYSRIRVLDPFEGSVWRESNKRSRYYKLDFSDCICCS